MPTTADINFLIGTINCRQCIMTGRVRKCAGLILCQFLTASLQIKHLRHLFKRILINIFPDRKFEGLLTICRHDLVCPRGRKIRKIS